MLYTHTRCLLYITHICIYISRVYPTPSIIWNIYVYCMCIYIYSYIPYISTCKNTYADIDYMTLKWISFILSSLDAIDINHQGQLLLRLCTSQAAKFNSQPTFCSGTRLVARTPARHNSAAPGRSEGVGWLEALGILRNFTWKWTWSYKMCQILWPVIRIFKYGDTLFARASKDLTLDCHCRISNLFGIYMVNFYQQQNGI